MKGGPWVWARSFRRRALTNRLADRWPGTTRGRLRRRDRRFPLPPGGRCFGSRLREPPSSGARFRLDQSTQRTLASVRSFPVRPCLRRCIGQIACLAHEPPRRPPKEVRKHAAERLQRAAAKRRLQTAVAKLRPPNNATAQLQRQRARSQQLAIPARRLAGMKAPLAVASADLSPWRCLASAVRRPRFASAVRRPPLGVIGSRLRTWRELA